MTKYKDRPYQFLSDPDRVKVKEIEIYIIDLKSNKFTPTLKILYDLYPKGSNHRGPIKAIKRLQAAGLVKISKYNRNITDVGKQLIEDLREMYPDKFPQKPIVAEEPKIEEPTLMIIGYDPQFLRLTRLKYEPKNDLWSFYLSGRWIMNKNGEKVIPFYNKRYVITDDAKDLKKIVGGEYNRTEWSKAPVLLKTLNRLGALEISKRREVLGFKKEFANLIKNLPESYKDLEKLEYK